MRCEGEGRCSSKSTKSTSPRKGSTRNSILVSALAIHSVALSPGSVLCFHFYHVSLPARNGGEGFGRFERHCLIPKAPAKHHHPSIAPVSDLARSKSWCGSFNVVRMSSPSSDATGTPQDDENYDVNDENESADYRYTNEETLLCIDFDILPSVDADVAFAKVSKFCQSFPFAAVLPVQPLHYMPVYQDGGVEVKFLRKKTATKNSIDGGIRFFLSFLSSRSVDEKNDAENHDGTTIQVTAKRNSRGQAISKLMTEKLVITNFVAAITGADDAPFGSSSTNSYVKVRSLYHKWM